ncbi:MAG: large repetitive protein, partial [Frankiaceae bacterium]|nr:large repetitive protein [Frankiaceae bacterium]
MPHAALPRSPLFRRLSTIALAAILGAAALPAVDAAAANATAASSASARAAAPTQTIPGLHAVKTHFVAIKRRDVSVPKHGSHAADAVTASDGTTASLVPAPPGGPARSTWVVNYDAGFTTAANGPAAQAAFQAAVDIWSHIVYSPVPIVVNASYANLGGNVLGQAAAYTGYYCGCIGDGVHVYPVALANALYGSDFDPSHQDITAQFNSAPVAPFYYGTDGAPTSGTVDFESVVLHELGHGLGFAGDMSMVSPATTVTYPTTYPPMKWDTFLQSGTGTSMLSYASGSSELTTAMESPLYWSGSNGVAANGSTNPAMYAPATWQQGSSGGAHLDESTYPIGNAFSLMTPSISAQEAVHSPGAVAVAMFKDIGWTASLPTGVPAAPTGVTATRGDTSASVSWTASTDYGSAVTQYVATASPGGATCSTTGGLSCTITGLTNGTSYTFTAKATNAYGTSAASTVSSAVVPAGKPGTPAAPTASPNNGGATVSWTAPSNNGAAITGYDVQSSSDNGTTWSAGPTSALTSTATQATFTGLNSATSYVFRVAAINTVGEGSASQASAAVTPAQTPAAPTGVQATRGNTQATVTWTAPSNTGGGAITGYRLEWSSDSGTTWSSPLSSALTSTTASAMVTGLTNGTAYVFHVAAINSIGTGAFSTQSSAITPAGSPAAPTNVGGTSGNGQVTVTWAAPSNNGDAITGYDVESSTNGTTWSAPVASALTSTATSAVVSSLTNGQAYYFRVAAINTVGTGTPAATAGTFTPIGTPAAPTNVSATRGATQAVILSWTAPSDNGGSAITSYVVRKSTDSGANWTTLGTTTGSPVNITGLTNGTSYVFDVAAINSIGAGTYSAASNAVTPATLPGAPTQVSGAAGDGQVSVTWTAPSNNGGAAVTGYTVEWSSDNGTTWSSPLASAQSSANAAALITGLTNGTSYVFRVAATNGVGTGSFSASSAAVTPAGAPSAPTGVSATAGDHQATVTFTVPSSNGGSAITSYDVRYSVDGGNSWDSAGVAYTGSPAVVTGLFNGAPYLFEVAAINAIGTSSYSAPSSAVVPAGLPMTPTGVSASAGNTQATVRWTAASANGSAITGYVVRFSTDSGAHWTGGSYTASPATVTSLTNGTPYIFEVAAVNGVGTGAYSAPTSAVTPSTIPGAPVFGTLTRGDTQVAVTWAAPSTGGSAITGYNLEWSSDSGSTWSAPLSSATTSAATSATVTGLTNGVAYVFRIAAVNVNGAGSFAAPSSAVTPAAVPAAPTSVTATRGDSSASVSWTAPANNGSAITTYEVRYSANNGTSWVSAGTAFSGSPVTVTGLTNGTAYVFDVAARNAVGQGAFSTSSSAVTPATLPGAPTAVTGSAGNGQVSLLWTAPSSDGGAAVTGYSVEWSSDSGATWSPQLSSATTSTATTATITGLTNGTAYRFRVGAMNPVGGGAFSASSAPITPATSPSAPTSASASAGDGQATVTWQSAFNGGSAITSYDVRYSTNGGSSWTSAGVAYGGSPAVVTGLTNGTSYVFDVAAINGIGASSYSAPSAAVVPAGVAGAPSAVSATAGDMQATVTWTAPAPNGTTITGYDVRYSSNGGSTWISAGAPYAGSPAVVTGLTNGTSYIFDVAAIDASGTGAYSAASAAVTPSTTPAVPAFVSLTRGNSQVSLTWSSGGNGGSAITGYDVEWTSDNGTTWSSPLSAATTSPATSTTVTGLTNGTTYKFRIAAINANGPSNFSAASNGVTPAAVPDAPMSATATRGNASVMVSWTAPSANGALITAYEVRYSTDSGTTWTSAGTGYGSSPVTVSGLSNGTSYVFDVAARNLVGQGAFSAASNAVVPATVPGVPTSVTGSPADGQVSLIWTGPSSDGGVAITGYDVEWSGDNGTTWSSPLASAQASTATTAIVTGLTNGTAYLFRVDAINGVGSSAWSDPSAAVTPAAVPGAPSGISAVAHDQSATVTWQAPSNGGSPITSYDVRYSTNGGTSWTSAGVAFAASPAAVTGLTNGTSYLFEVTAINGVGTGAYSSPSAAIVPAGVPVAPTAVSATRGDTQATVTWTAASA